MLSIPPHAAAPREDSLQSPARPKGRRTTYVCI